MMKLLRSSEFTLIASAIVAAAATGLTYAYLGFLGVALTGSAILFPSAQADLGQDTMLGLIAMERVTPAERRTRKAKGEGMPRLWRLTRSLGLVLAVIGFAGFFLLQIPH